MSDPAAPSATITFAELFQNFLDWTGSRPIPSFLYRGQGEDVPLRPKIGRPDYNYSQARELQMFRAFKDGARPFLQQKPESDWEWLALAQHHGAPTRLMDWSANALVAAWFAVTSYPLDKDAVVYALDTSREDVLTLDVRSGQVSSGLNINDPLAPMSGVFSLETAPVSPRITTQRGIFTSHGSPTSPLVIEPENKFHIPQSLRGDMQGQLLDFGMDASHIFPDLDGFCDSLDWRFRSGKAFQRSRKVNMMDSSTATLDATPLVVGLMPHGVVKELAQEIASKVRDKVEQLAAGLTVRSVRLVPSSTIQIDDNTIQFIANATVVPLPTDGRPARAKVVDSVITVTVSQPAQIKEISVPFLEPQSAAA